MAMSLGPTSIRSPQRFRDSDVKAKLTVAHARAGHCIARELPDESELPVMFLGQPAAEEMESTLAQEGAWGWSARESAIDDSIRNAPAAARARPRCSYPAPAWRAICQVCGFEMGRYRGPES